MMQMYTVDVVDYFLPRRDLTAAGRRFGLDFARLPPRVPSSSSSSSSLSSRRRLGLSLALVFECPLDEADEDDEDDEDEEDARPRDTARYHSGVFFIW